MRSLALCFAMLLIFLTIRPSAAEVVHRWSFATDAGDSVGRANGSLEGEATVSDGRVVLNGTTAYVALPIGGTMEKLTNSTFEVWVTWDQMQRAWLRIFDFGTGPGASMYVTPRNGRSDAGSSTNTLRFTITPEADPGEQQVNTPDRFPVGAETHVALTIDADADVARLYVNGSLVGTQEGLTYSPSDLGNTTRNWLGRSQFGSDPYFRGSISEFRIHNAALTAEQVSQSFQLGPDKLAPDRPVVNVAAADVPTASQVACECPPQPCCAQPRGRILGRLFGRSRR
jgi:hypothetical protein